MQGNKVQQQKSTGENKGVQSEQQMKKLADKTESEAKQYPLSTQKPFRVLNLTFASKKVLTDFLLYSLLIILVPIILVYSTYNHVKDNPRYTELDKVVVSVGPSLLFINILIGIYIYKVVKDPENYTKDQPLKPFIPVGLKEQNMNKRMKNKNQAIKKQSQEKQQKNASQASQKKPKSQ